MRMVLADGTSIPVSMIVEHSSTLPGARSFFSSSFWRTPKRCSSSMITNPRFLNFTSFWISLCVPMTMSSAPAASPSRVFATSFGLRKRESSATRTGKLAKRSLKFWKCCSVRSVVGTRIATCMPAAQPVQRRAFGRGSGIAADDMQLRYRHVELIAAFVFEVQEFHLALAEVERDQSEVAPDAVLAVHHRIAGLDLREVAHHPFGAAARARVAAARFAHLPRVDLGLGDDRDCLVAHYEAQCDRTLDQR